jgi:hypothetical protein
VLKQLDKRRKRTRTGAVMVEAVLVVSALAGLFAWHLYMQRLTTAKLDSMYAARSAAWKEAMSGCGDEGGFDIRSAVTSFTHKEDTDATGWLGLGKRIAREDSRSESASSPLSVSGTVHSKTLFPCTLVPPRADPIGDPSGWVFDLFL